MKIALCMTGQPRHFKKGYESIKKHIIDVNQNIDIFLHAWFDEENIGSGYNNTSRTLQVDGYDNDIITRDLPKQLLDLYHPKKYIIEKQIDCNQFIKDDYSKRGNLTNPFASFSQYLSFEKSIQLKNDFGKYDMVFKCRYDAYLENNIILINYDKKYVYFPDDVKDDSVVKISDVIYFGNNDTMDNISSCYQYFDYYWRKYNLHWCNHELLGKFLIDKNIQYKKTNLGKILLHRK